MLANAKRRYIVGQYTVERRPAGWVYCLTGHEREAGAWSRPYSSIKSVTLMVARQLQKELARRDELYNID